MINSKQLSEVAMIAVILGDHFTAKLYEKMKLDGKGYISTSEEISVWSILFFNMHKNTNWEKVLENGLKPLSIELSSIECYDEAIIDFGFYKLNQFE